MFNVFKQGLVKDRKKDMVWTREGGIVKIRVRKRGKVKIRVSKRAR